MVLSLSTALKKEASRGSLQPVVIAKIALSQRIFITVVDFSAATGMTFDVTIGAQFEIFAEGVDFTVGSGSNQSMAAEIVASINSRFANKAKATLIRGNETVSLVAGRAFLSIGFTSSNSLAIDKIFPDGPAEIGFCTGEEVVFSHTPSISEISDIAQTLDPITRAFSVGELDLTFIDDGLLREVFRVYPLKGAKVTLLWGTLNITTESDWAKIPSMFIQESLPEGGGSIQLKLGTFPHFLRDIQITLGQIAKHPLEMIEEVFNAAGFSAGAGFYDPASFDPSNVDYVDIAHWAVSRFNDPFAAPQQNNAINDPEPALDIVHNLLTILGGTILSDEDGVYAYKHYDPAAAADKILDGGTGDDGNDIDIVDQLSTWDDIVTIVKVNFGHEDKEGFTRVFEKLDRSALDIFGEFSIFTIDTKWINGRNNISLSSITGPSNPSSPTNQLLPDSTGFIVPGAIRAGVTGGRYDYSVTAGFTQKAEAVLSTSQHAFLRIDPPGRVETIPATIRNDLGGEIIAISGIALDVGTIDPIERDFPNLDDFVPKFPTFLIDTTFTGAATTNIGGKLFTADELGFTAGRGGLNTGTPAAWGSSGQIPKVVDVTLQMWIVLRILERSRLGVSRVRVRTSLKDYDLEVGDFASIDNDDIFLSWNVDGLSSAIVFEVVRKELHLFEDSPGVVFELAFVRDDSVDASIITPADWTPADVGPIVTFPLDEVVTDNALVNVQIDADGDGFADTVVRRG